MRQLAPLFVILAACSDDPSGTSDTSTTSHSDATDTGDTGDTGDTTSVNGCSTSVVSGMSGTWGALETQTALVQVEPFGTLTQVSTSLYLATLSGTDPSTITYELCDWLTTDDSSFFTTVMGASVLASLDPFVRTMHLSERADGTVGFEVDNGFSLRGVHLDNPATDVMPTDASDSRVYDQDGDGNPGISLVISGAVSGQLYTIHRHQAALDGCFTSQDRIVGLTDWTTDQIILGSNPQNISANKPVATTHPDASLSHFVMVKLADGDTCAELKAKRATLFPE